RLRGGRLPARAPDGADRVRLPGGGVAPQGARAGRARPAAGAGRARGDPLTPAYQGARGPTVAGVSTDRLALISDVHGNLTALEAVLDDIAGRGIRRVLNLGDVAGKGPRGAAAVDRCREVCEVTVRGNWDDALPRVGDDAPAATRWWRDQLRPDQRDWLTSLPLSHDLLVSGRRVRLFHASCGRTRERPTLVNAGSVGNPLDEPVSSYVVLEGVVDGTAPAPCGIQVVRVPYDVDAEVAVAHAVGMPATDVWEVELRTAR